jgi:hypothetical protein
MVLLEKNLAFVNGRKLGRCRAGDEQPRFAPCKERKKPPACWPAA